MEVSFQSFWPGGAETTGQDYKEEDKPPAAREAIPLLKCLGTALTLMGGE